MSYLVCCVPVCPMRAEPAHRSEMVSQLLFGEYCEVLEEGKDQWTKIKCKYDGYEGWCQGGQLTPITEAQYTVAGKSYTQEWLAKMDYDGQPMMAPFGSWLTNMHNGNIAWGNHLLTYTGKPWNSSAAVISEQAVRQVAFHFLNTAYLWGGKSIFGIDCSGFVQTVFRFFDIPLLRDASLQATQGDTINALQEARCGDLAFFDNEAGRITHVGILLNAAEIIHASVKVRVDKIDDNGIIHAETRQQTHKLKMIKRYF